MAISEEWLEEVEKEAMANRSVEDPDYSSSPAEEIILSLIQALRTERAQSQNRYERAKNSEEREYNLLQEMDILKTAWASDVKKLDIERECNKVLREAIDAMANGPGGKNCPSCSREELASETLDKVKERLGEK